MNVENIKKLREETGAGVMEVKQALEEANGDYTKAYESLMKNVSKKASKKQDREIKDGLVHTYVHANGRVGSMVLVGCETDFVAKTDAFKNLCHEVALQVCTDNYESVTDLLNSEYIKDTSKKIQDIVNETIAKLGEKIEIVKFVKFDVNE